MLRAHLGNGSCYFIKCGGRGSFSEDGGSEGLIKWKLGLGKGLAQSRLMSVPFPNKSKGAVQKI